MDARAVAELIRQEHPQIIAIVLAYLDADQSAEVLAQFPEWLRADVVMRIATLDGIQPTALHELDEVIEKQFAGKTGALKTSVIGGVKTRGEHPELHGFRARKARWSSRSARSTRRSAARSRT